LKKAQEMQQKVIVTLIVLPSLVENFHLSSTFPVI
jgi:hypothetical protein